jgi:hypothetical protein
MESLFPGFLLPEKLLGEYTVPTASEVHLSLDV